MPIAHEKWKALPLPPTGVVLKILPASNTAPPQFIDLKLEELAVFLRNRDGLPGSAMQSHERHEVDEYCQIYGAVLALIVETHPGTSDWFFDARHSPVLTENAERASGLVQEMLHQDLPACKRALNLQRHNLNLPHLLATPDALANLVAPLPPDPLRLAFVHRNVGYMDSIEFRVSLRHSGEEI
jgi:hypothetical protein